jgi:hypothetical protein
MPLRQVATKHRTASTVGRGSTRPRPATSSATALGVRWARTCRPWRSALGTASIVVLGSILLWGATLSVYPHTVEFFDLRIFLRVKFCMQTSAIRGGSSVGNRYPSYRSNRRGKATISEWPRPPPTFRNFDYPIRPAVLEIFKNFQGKLPVEVLYKQLF